MFNLVAIIGEQGDGKTALATKVAIEEYEINPKRIVIANYKINGIKMLNISFYDVITMLGANSLPEFIHDDVGNKVNFIEMFEDIYGFVPESVDDVFLNSVCIFDELHIVADSYDFLGKSARVLSTFITQIRKRGILFIGVSQHLNQVAKRIRNHMRFIIEVQKTDIPGISYVETYGGRLNDELILAKYEDLTPFFDRYDSRQIILYKPDKDDD